MQQTKRIKTNIKDQLIRIWNFFDKNLKGIILFCLFSFFGFQGIAQYAPNDDFDGDGIVNSIDLDDDNDGILDCDESYSGGVNLADALTTTPTELYPNSLATYTGAVVQGDPDVDMHSINTEPSGNWGLATYTNTGFTYEFTTSQPVDLEILPMDQNVAGIYTTNDRITFSSNGAIFLDNPNEHLEVSTDNGETWFTPQTFVAKNILFRPIQKFDVGEAEFSFSLDGATSFSYKMASTGANPNGTTFKMNVADCSDIDTDLDGIADRFDYDSDGDGCTDAIEGSALFDYTNIDGSGRLLGSVDVNGVPVMATSSGQALGTSIDPNTQDINCCDVTVAGDCDGDGVDNLVDCDPLDPNISYTTGDACVNSQGEAGTIDSNCMCIASYTAEESSSGFDGGLESNGRLAEQIAQFKYQNFMDGLGKKLSTKDEKLFMGASLGKTTGELELRNLIPTRIWDAHVIESSPTHLSSITNATEAIAADYYIDEKLNAAILGIKTENQVYEHTKYICDRLEKSKLTDIAHFAYGRHKLIAIEVQRENQIKEYSISFSGYLKNDEFYLRSHWNLDQYEKDQNYFNFQIWSTNLEKVKSLAISLIRNIEKEVLIVSSETSDIPEVFIKNVEYKNGQVQMTVVNLNGAKEIKLKANYRPSEKHGCEESMAKGIALKGSLEENITINTGYLYDMGLCIASGDHSDNVFIADGIWGVEESNPKSELIEKRILLENRIYQEDAYMVERGIDVEAEVLDYINFYRSLTPKWQEVDLSDYKHMGISLEGEGLVQINLVDPNIRDWEKQLNFQINLSEGQTNHSLNLSDFNNFKSSKDLENIQMITISLIGDNQSKRNLKMMAKNISFSASLPRFDEKEQNNIALFPNPAKHYFSLLNLPQGENYEMKIISTQGQTERIENIDPFNHGPYSIENLLPGMHFIQITNLNDGKTSVKKLIVIPE